MKSYYIIRRHGMYLGTEYDSYKEAKESLKKYFKELDGLKIYLVEEREIS